MMNKLIKKILWQKKNRWELLLAAAGFFLGLSLFLFCLQVIIDVNHIFNTRMTLEKQPDYLIISKKLVPDDLLDQSDVIFSDKEIASIKAQPFILDVGVILANEFETRAGVELLGKGFVTECFFESMEDRFLDFVPEEWDWQEGDNQLPVMISRDFLMLYNFGFSRARGFPFVSEEMLKLIPIQLIISGGNKSRKFNARIVGLSDRVTSILVPYSFMIWANARYYNSENNTPLRLILSVKDRSDPRIRQFIEKHNYETSREKLRLSDAGLTIALVLSIIAVIGLVLIFLSFVIFITTFRLVISRSKTEIHLLLDLGYKPVYLVQNLMRMLAVMFIIIFLATAVALSAGIVVFHNFLAENGFQQDNAFNPLVPGSGLLFIFLALFLNRISISHTVRKAGA